MNTNVYLFRRKENQGNTNLFQRSLNRFCIDAELKIWITGTAAPIEKEFKSDKSIYDIQRALATYVLR